MYLIIIYLFIIAAVIKAFFQTSASSDNSIELCESTDEDIESDFQIGTHTTFFKFTYDSLFEKVRFIFRKMKKSPMKNSFVQKYISKNLGKTLEPILDCKTRWNSNLPIVERFLTIHDSIKVSGAFDVDFTGNELEILEVF